MLMERGYPICNGCKYSSLHYCHKYNQECVSMFFAPKRVQIACSKCFDENGYEVGESIYTIPRPEKIGYFHLPGIENFTTFKCIAKMKEYYPKAFYTNREISEIYGAFPGAIWNGRTPNFNGTVLTMQQIDKVRKNMEELGLTMNLTWNNHLVVGTDVYDRFCNNITEIFHNGKHAITVASDELFKYLKEKYPNFKYYKSVITTELDKTFLENQDYDMLLMNRKLNNNWDELLKIPEDKRSNIEFLCNDACTPICNRMGHYNIANKCLLQRLDEGPFTNNYCTIDHDFMLYNVDKWPMTITPDDIDEYINNGYVHFKLCSRGDDTPVIAYKVARYLAKPQYVGDVFCWALGRDEPEERLKNNDAVIK